ncbi:MAG: alpha-amylase family glycosyl hydrolase [Paludibacter sp.]|nr:alpha-amylase family glycosyl hydrolase [Paludibacter sp.]
MKLFNLKSQTIMLNAIIMSAILSFGACTKTSDITEIADNTNPDPVQYGIPYGNVPDTRDAVIYQANMRSFSSTRNFQGIIYRLDSIKNLGINVIYLMPIYPVGTLKSINSPYCVKDYTAVNSGFGTLTDLRNLIDGAHTRGMSVILDWVGNHTSWDNAWISHSSWYVKDSNGNIISPNGWNDVAQLNFQSQDMRKEMIKDMKYWVYTANCDGFRCDYADGPPADFWKQAIDSLRNIKTHKLLMLAEGTRADHYTSGFNFTFGFRFYDQLKTIYSNNQPVTNIDDINAQEFPSGTSEMNLVVRYITNHDVNGSDGTPLDLFGGSTGSMAAFVVAAYMKGVPMIYDGQEVGTTYRLTFPFTGATINWASNPAMNTEYKKIIAFRNNSTALRRGTLVSYSNSNVCAFTKSSGTETVLVLCNLRNSSTNFTIPTSLANSVWSDAFTGNSVSITTQVPLSGFSYLVLKK